MGISTFVNQPTQASPTPRKQKANGVDIPLLLTAIALATFGMLMVYSASYDFSRVVYENPNYMFNKQLLWLIVGAILAFILSRIDYHTWRKYALFLILATIGLLIGVLINNEVRLGAVRTLLGGSVQPSELAKVATIIYLSVWLYSKRDQFNNVQIGLIPLAMILGIIGGLIYIQPDLSATATVFMLGGMLFFLAGGDLRQIMLFMFVALIAGLIVVQFSDTGSDRLAWYLRGLEDPLNAHYQVRRSLEAIVNGGWFGNGIGLSKTKYLGLPVPPTDSIFAVVVEEFGLVGAIGLIGLFGMLLWRGLRIASKAPDLLGMLLAAGLTFWIVMEAFINMGVMVGIFPLAGNALPFISAGGSSLVSSLAAIGILLNVSQQAGQGSTTEEWRSLSAAFDLRRWNRRRRQSSSRRFASHRRQD